MNKINKNIKTAKNGMMREMGMKTKKYAQENVIGAGIAASGNLLKSIHFRTMKNSATVWTDAGYATSWEFGMRPHFIHRNMISAGGYSVGEWMNAKGFSPRRNYILVGAGTQIGTGIQFMQRAFFRLNSEAPMIVNKWARRILK